MNTNTTVDMGPKDFNAEVSPIAEEVCELVRRKKELENEIEVLREKLKEMDLRDKNSTVAKGFSFYPGFGRVLVVGLGGS